MHLKANPIRRPIKKDFRGKIVFDNFFSTKVQNVFKKMSEKKVNLETTKNGQNRQNTKKHVLSYGVPGVTKNLKK